MKRYKERKVKDCDGDWFSTGMEESDNGKWVKWKDVRKKIKEIKNITPEQKARALLERMDVPNAQKYTAGELVELANLFAK